MAAALKFGILVKKIRFFFSELTISKLNHKYSPISQENAYLLHSHEIFYLELENQQERLSTYLAIKLA